MKFVSLFGIFFFSLLFTACSSIESDAKKAAELDKESIIYTRKGDLEKAEKNYAEIKKIINKYEQNGQIKEFYKSYELYLQQPDN